ncbi:hypothetical protein BC833DRAFT_358800 [Globomyces pollinis-pini]|nr:hypothetical protein BC833DRAFT_358800 [Globomyces pollinis-pini]
MDFPLRCNNLKCRKQISSKGVVTTCSHIFCMECGQRYFETALICPACDTSLTQKDDIVINDLCPTDDYKSSILSGLSPEIICEIASRSLSFWVYQISQEAAYQDIIRKTLNEKCSELERNTQIVIREANQEIEALQEKYKVASHDRELEKRRIHELTEQMNEKSRQLQKLQVLYDKLKRKTPISQKESDIQVPNGHFLKHDRSTFKFEKLQHNVHSSTDRFTLPSKFGQSRSGDVNLTPRTFTSFMNQNSSRFESPVRPSSRASFRR